jgi:hypothetical protein
MQTIEILPYGMSWPSVGCAETALLAVSESELEECLSRSLARGMEEGLGAWAAIALRLPSAAIVELVNYLERPGQSAFIVRTVATASPEAVLSELLVCLGLTQSSIIWRAGNAVA